MKTSNNSFTQFKMECICATSYNDRMTEKEEEEWRTKVNKEKLAIVIRYNTPAVTLWRLLDIIMEENQTIDLSILYENKTATKLRKNIYHDKLISEFLYNSKVEQISIYESRHMFNTVTEEWSELWDLTGLLKDEDKISLNNSKTKSVEKR